MDIFRNSKLTKTKAQMKNDIENTLIFRRFSLVALNNFEWLNLPEEIQPRFIERALFYNGSAVFAKTEKYGYIVLPACMTGDLNLYYEPQKWNVIGKSFVEGFTDKDSVLIRNNMFCTPSYDDVMWYAQKISDIERTIDVNINLHKIPWLFKGNNRNMLSLKNIFKQVEQHEPAIYVDESMDPKAFNVFQTNQPYIVDKLEDYKKLKTAEFFEMWGYPTTQTEKNERLTMTESEVKVEFSDSGYVGTMYEYRKEACKAINDMFGLNIDVKINRYREKSEEYYELEKMKLQAQGYNSLPEGEEVKENGDLHNNS